LDSASSYLRVKSEIGDPVQLSDIRPVTCKSLGRLGNANDGGYVVPLQAVEAARALISFGLSHDWTFERDFSNRNPDAIIHCYDHTVSIRTAFQHSIGQLLRFVLLFRASSLRKAFTWIDYWLFFRAGSVHFRQKIGRDNEDDGATISDVFNRLPAECPVFIKMDIEGSEYSVIDDLLLHSGNIVAMAIEFHDLDTLSDLFNSCIERIKREFYIVHVHGNNMGGMTSFNFPTTPEITFLNKHFFNSIPASSDLKYPVSGLDQPNNSRIADFTLEF
jgi:hypothetical protein